MSDESSEIVQTITKTNTHQPHVESYPVQITSIRLNGDNFVRWSQSVRMYIRGRGKIGYLTGETKKPASTDLTYSTWDAENSMVMTWLVNSMDEDISSNYMCYSTAKDLWDNVTEMYSDLKNQSQIYELTLKLGELRQREDTVTRKTVEAYRIYKFLAGLNVEFEEVRARIIGRTPLPSISEVFAEVRREESRRHVMLGKNIISQAENSALASVDITAHKAVVHKKRTEEKPRIWCDFCNKPRHTRETCWKIHGKPPNWKSSKSGDQNNRFPTANEAETSPFNKEQISHLLILNC
ncbi:uncharacterized protein LOC141705998 [Apium graveolens]|uniref:uncharacterized protein LOC141705998 n=1 Tax=Apium graveolens TaxID=4045 RepID=UPI003D7BA188